jgi:CubicO group peptidase (beta-lactamase class C family)
LLISLLIEKVTGTSKFQFIKKEVLDPLGLKNTFGSIHEINMDRLMSGYYVGVEEDIKTTDYGSMIATAEDVGKFLRALNDGSVFNEGEQEIYSSIYEYNHTGLIPGYQSIAKYHEDIDAVVIQFNNTTNFDGYDWSLAEITYRRVVKILSKKKHDI